MNKAKYLPFFENMIVIAKIPLAVPVSNDASALKSRLRSRFKSDILQCLLHIKINGPNAKTT